MTLLFMTWLGLLCEQMWTIYFIFTNKMKVFLFQLSIFYSELHQISLQYKKWCVTILKNFLLFVIALPSIWILVLSGSTTRTSMDGADVTIAWVDNSREANAVDYHLRHRVQVCRLAMLGKLQYMTFKRYLQ